VLEGCLLGLFAAVLLSVAGVVSIIHGYKTEDPPNDQKESFWPVWMGWKSRMVLIGFVGAVVILALWTGFSLDKPGLPGGNAPLTSTSGGWETVEGEVACRSSEWLGNMPFVAREDELKSHAYLVSGKCVFLEGGRKVKVIDHDLLTVEFDLDGTRYWADLGAVSSH